MSYGGLRPNLIAFCHLCKRGMPVHGPNLGSASNYVNMLAIAINSSDSFMSLLAGEAAAFFSSKFIYFPFLGVFDGVVYFLPVPFVF